MSSLANWTYLNPATIWKVNFDDSGQASYDSPYLIQCDWMVGGELAADANGNEFLPASTYFFEAADGSELIPEQEDFILRGDHTSTASPYDANAERIKKVVGWAMTAFGSGELPDWKILT